MVILLCSTNNRVRRLVLDYLSRYQGARYKINLNLSNNGQIRHTECHVPLLVWHA